MNDRTPALERARQEYAAADLSASTRVRIRNQVFGATRARSPSRWASAFAVGVAAGLVAVSAHYFLTREPPPRAFAFAAIAISVEGSAGIAETDASQHPLHARDEIAAGTWLETDETASVGVEIGPHKAKVGASTRLMFERVEQRHMAFSLQRGSVRFDVDPLPAGSSLSVRSGGLTVNVVGTAFSVERSGACAQVSVSEGLVRTSFEGREARVSAGSTERYCESTSTAPVPPAPPPRGVEVEADTRAPAVVTAASSGTTADGGSAAPAASRAFTEEERLFKSGLEALQAGKTGAARDALERYLQRYPGGSFAQDAELHLVRLSYASGQSAQTITYGRRFLSRVGGGARSDEVRVLVAQSLLQQGAEPGEALELVAPVAERLRGSTSSFAEQVTYLAVLAASRSGRHDQSQEHARSYLIRFPQGRYADEVRKVAGP